MSHLTLLVNLLTQIMVIFLPQGGKELVGVTGVGRPSHRWPPLSPSFAHHQRMCSHLLLPVR